MDIFIYFLESLLQVFVLAVVPFTWWFVTERKKKSFFKWIGLKKILVKNKNIYKIYFLSVLLLFMLMMFITPFLVDEFKLASSQFQEKNFTTIIKIFIFAFIQTGLSEEIFFRGFLTKRFIESFGFLKGNIFQSLLFGLMHGILFIFITGIYQSVLIVLLSCMLGFAMGYINEKLSNGSIVSSWILHGIANLLSSLF